MTFVATKQIRVSEPCFIGNERTYVADAIHNGQISYAHGPHTKSFEDQFASYIGVKHAISCSSGTAALHLALLALGVKKGDGVIVPALSYVATANAVHYCGAEPIFCDIDPKTWCIDVELFEALIHQYGDRIKGIIPVHLYGVPCQMNSINEIANRYNLFVVEDAAEAHGANYDGKKVGSLGHVGAFSFYANKIITCGEGGMVTTDHDRFADLARLYRGQGQGRFQYLHEVVGYNYRMTNLQGALGLAQLEGIDAQIEARRRVRLHYLKRLQDSGEFSALTPQLGYVGCDPVCWMFSVLLPAGIPREHVMQKLAEAGIETRPFFVPLNELPMYRSKPLPITHDIASRGINLPTHPGLSGDDIDYVVENLFLALKHE